MPGDLSQCETTVIWVTWGSPSSGLKMLTIAPLLGALR